MANKDDFRYKATEEAIVKAFMELAQGKRACEVPVSELCKRAGISRNAFYLHYSGMPDLCHTLVDGLMSEVERECLASTERALTTNGFDESWPSSILDAFEAHEELLRVLMSADNGETSCYLASALEHVYADAASAFGDPCGTREYRLVCAFAAWAHVGFIKRWFAETDQPLSEARPCFVELGSQMMDPRFHMLANAQEGTL